MTSPSQPAAVLFDMDGTLVDTEPYWIAAEHALVEQYGGRWSEELGLQLVGNDLITSAHFIRAHSPVTMEPEEIIEYLLQRVVVDVRRHAPFRPGAVELLAAVCAAGIRTALVTMSYTEFADAVADALPPGVGFDVVVTGDRVSRGKPDPEAYLLAVDELGLRPQDCLAIEDSPSGLRSAVAADVPTIVVPHVVEVPELAGSLVWSTLEGRGVEDLSAAYTSLLRA